MYFSCTGGLNQTKVYSIDTRSKLKYNLDALYFK